MSDFKIIVTTVIPTTITEVWVYQETIDHVTQNHPEIPAELPSIVQAVETAIKNPSYITASTQSSSYVFVDMTSTNKSGDPLRVPVKIVSGTSARMKTFYFSSTSYAPTVIWRKSDHE